MWTEKSFTKRWNRTMWSSCQRQRKRSMLFSVRMVWKFRSSLSLWWLCRLQKQRWGSNLNFPSKGGSWYAYKGLWEEDSSEDRLGRIVKDCSRKGHPSRTSALSGGGGVLNRISIVISIEFLLLNPERRMRRGARGSENLDFPHISLMDAPYTHSEREALIFVKLAERI